MSRLKKGTMYVETQSLGPRINTRYKACYRDWWLVKQDGHNARVHVGHIYLPKSFLGKRIKIIVEVLEV